MINKVNNVNIEMINNIRDLTKCYKENHGNQAAALSNSETDRTNTILFFLSFIRIFPSVDQQSTTFNLSFFFERHRHNRLALRDVRSSLI